MNDPHVVALHYDVLPGDQVDFDAAPALERSFPDFRVRLANSKLRVQFDGPHYSSEDEARRAVQDFLDAWEIAAGLNNRPGVFRFRFTHAEVIDRKPSPHADVVYASDFVNITLFEQATVHVSHSRYPEPPVAFGSNDAVKHMYARYERYRQGRETLAGTAYFCLTVLGQPRKVATQFGIDLKVLKKISELSSIKGGTEARKKIGLTADWTPVERRWLEAAIVTMIRRAAERVGTSQAALPQIAMADLPRL